MYVEMKNIYKKYGDFLASDNVSFGVEKGKLGAAWSVRQWQDNTSSYDSRA